MTTPRTILVIGDLQRAEMRPVADWIGSRSDCSAVRHCRSFSDAATEPPPDVVIVCQAWPDEFSATEVSAAISRWPLSIWVCCYGAWCSADGRTRSIWPVSVRVPVNDAADRLDHVWDVVTRQRGSPLPLTASRDEVFEFDHCREVGRSG
jgi:hypothetical protein